MDKKYNLKQLGFKINLIKRIFGYCPHCNLWFVYPKIRRMNTAYTEDKINYCYECDFCFGKTEEYWEEMREEYDSGRF